MSYIKRSPLTQTVRASVLNNARFTQSDENGNIVSPNETGKVLNKDTKADIGHGNEFENRYEIEYSEKAGLTQADHNKLFTNPGTLQLEPRDENRSHEFECNDQNEAMQNISAYAYSQISDIAENTYINPSEDGRSGTISVVNKQTGEENTVCSYGLPGNGDINGVDLSSGNSLDGCYSDCSGKEDSCGSVSSEALDNGESNTP